MLQSNSKEYIPLLDEDCAAHSNTTEIANSPNAQEMEVEETHKRRPYIGLTCAVISSLFFSLASAIVKYLNNINPYELVVFQFFGILILTLPCLIASKEDVWPKGKRLMLTIRSILGTISTTLMFYAFKHMQLGDAFVIIFSSSVLVIVSARVFLKELFDVISIVCILLTMIGVLLITKPPFLFYGDGVEDFSTESLWGALSATISAIVVANVYIVLRILKGVHWSVVTFNFSIFATLMTSSFTLAVGEVYFPLCAQEWLMILALGALNFGGQCLLTLSLKFEQAGSVAIAGTTDVVFAYILQILFFHEVPTVWSIAGALLVTSSVLLTAIRK